MAPRSEDRTTSDFTFHRLSWADFDAFARIGADKPMLRRLREAERSRRKLLLFALLEAAAKMPDQLGPLPPIDAVWELFERVEAAAPGAFDRLLAHPYTGAWAGYSTRLLRDGLNGVGPFWVHLGHVHAIAAAAAIRARLDFAIAVPSWHGDVALPSLGLVRLPASRAFSMAEVRGGAGGYVVSHEGHQVRVPDRPDADAPGWLGVRRVRARAGRERFSVRLDDLDPYRGLYEPVPPQRLGDEEFGEWRRLIDESWRLLTTALPTYAQLLPVGLDSLVPKPTVLFRNPSASTGEAFGSAVVSRPSDAASLAATLIHEFQHIVLGGVLHLTQLYDNDPRERIYVPWRDDPRPLSGAVQGVYAFFGVTAFWRALAMTGADALPQRAWFEFSYWRRQTWLTLESLRRDARLTDTGRRFLDGIAEVLGPWRGEPIAQDVTELATAAAVDHRAGWRARHLRPDPDLVAELVTAWQAGRSRPPLPLTSPDLPPTPVPDGEWSHAREDLVRLVLAGSSPAELCRILPAVPDATAADLAYATGRIDEAARAYRAELAVTPDRPASLVGLGLALAATGTSPTAHALLHHPELVRAVHRKLGACDAQPPSPERLARWIGQSISW
jgi:HEXXH motif-containing protein